MDNKKTKTYNYGNLFSITVCQNCFEYRIDHDPNKVFHSIDTKHLGVHKNGILTPKGDPEVPYYYHYLKRRFIHLGPLCVSGLFEDNPNVVFFGFDINRIKKRYPSPRYIDYSIWEILSCHADAQPSKDEKILRDHLFLSDYLIKPVSEVLLDELDCSLAEVAIAKKSQEREKVNQFIGKKLETILFEDTEQIEVDWTNYISIQLDCECNITNFGYSRAYEICTKLDSNGKV